MKLKDMRPGIYCRVLSDGRILRKGDSARIAPYGYMILVRDGSEIWLPIHEWMRLKNRVKIDSDYYNQEIDVLNKTMESHMESTRLCQATIDHYKSIIEEKEQR